MRLPASFRRRREADPDPGWTLTLADMMTLLLCFFVLLLTLSQVDRQRYEAMSSVMARAMGGKAAPQAAGAPAPGAPPASLADAAAAPRRNLFELQLELAARIGEDRTHVDLAMRTDPYGVAIRLGDELLFDSGSAELKPGAEALLSRLAGPLADSPYHLEVEGHTDDVPIHAGAFPSNWELSAARAAAVARYLMDHGLDRTRVKVVGLADTRPVAGNDTDQGRAANRRVVILVQP
ncbi:MAG: flagellar motor protein MotB [Desulfovibrionaceae bacterium]